MNVLTLVFFVFMVAVLSLAIIKVNTSEESDACMVAVNVIIGICLTALIMFLPFGTDAPKTLFGRAVSFFKPDTAETVDNPVTLPVTEATEPEEEELPDFVVYECDDYYIGMNKGEHVMKIVPSDESLENAKATDKLAYYDFSGKYVLDGFDINVYAAKLADDPGFVCIVLFEQYYQEEVNTVFRSDEHLYRIYEEGKGYMYLFIYEYDNMDMARNFTYNMNNDSVSFKGMNEALNLDKKYFEADE